MLEARMLSLLIVGTLLCGFADAQTPGEYADYLRSDTEDHWDVANGPVPVSDVLSENVDRYGEDFNGSDDAGLTHDGCGARDCCGSCDRCCPSCCEAPRLFGLLAPSDPEFSNFISPISNPLLFEDPRSLTEIRGHFVNQVIPASSGLGKGDVQLYAAQLRAALTNRFSIIATKDGYMSQQFDNLPNNDGFANLAAGLKYAFLYDPARQLIGTAGMTFEVPLGGRRVFQGYGDGDFNFFLTGGAEIFDRGHWLSGTGFRIPTDHTQGSQMWWWSNHWDYEVINGLYGLVELNWFHWMRSGERLPLNFEGGDLLDLGSNDVAGNDIVTMAIGGRAKLTQSIITGVGWEFPLTNRRDLLHDRLYVDLILRY